MSGWPRFGSPVSGSAAVRFTNGSGWVGDGLRAARFCQVLPDSVLRGERFRTVQESAPPVLDGSVSTAGRFLVVSVPAGDGSERFGSATGSGRNGS